MIFQSILLIAALHPAQQDVPRPRLNIEGLKTAAADLISGTNIKGESGFVVESPAYQQIQGCLSLNSLDSDSGAVCLEGLRLRLAYERDFYVSRSGDILFRKDAFEWQLFSSRLIFVLVLIVVSAGLAFSGLQFYIDYKLKTRSQDRKRKSEDGKELPAEAAPPQDSKVQLTKDGLIVSSPILGVIVLVISVTFLYLYLQFVYPIHEL